ncbi:hypothetical protein Tsp_03528 [Trichinella spiralis]|uniref:hypothetical protein n=1 Tax=Trichinella spiralis TaxID=6334 RepID=UPI0001EFB61A|nr:hypothetical protein Tsp_03528 [Trichinella spiralis]
MKFNFTASCQVNMAAGAFIITFVSSTAGSRISWPNGRRPVDAIFATKLFAKLQSVAAADVVRQRQQDKIDLSIFRPLNFNSFLFVFLSPIPIQRKLCILTVVWLINNTWGKWETTTTTTATATTTTTTIK